VAAKIFGDNIRYYRQNIRQNKSHIRVFSPLMLKLLERIYLFVFWQNIYFLSPGAAKVLAAQ